MKRPLAGALLALALTGAQADNRFCGGAVAQTGEPTDLAHVVGDQTLEYMAEQPASLMVCSKGYLLEKCGDHETAMKVFDRCIAAGYIGAMIWKALMLQDGAGVAPDLAGAAELMRRAAQAGDSPYATLGKLHYASALHEGKGVARDEAEARRWFEAAAADGNPDAIEFLRTGYHVGDRDGRARGVGVPPLPVGAQPLPGDLLEAAAMPAPAPLAAASPGRAETRPVARRLADGPDLPAPPSSLPAQAPVAAAVTARAPVGQHLQRVVVEGPVEAAAVSGWLPVLLLAAFLSGLLRQWRPRRPVAASSLSVDPSPGAPVSPSATPFPARGV